MIVPELEELLKSGKKRPDEWTEEEDDTLRRYYKRVSPKELIKYLNNRNEVSVRLRVHILKAKGKWREE